MVLLYDAKTREPRIWTPLRSALQCVASGVAAAQRNKWLAVRGCYSKHEGVWVACMGQTDLLLLSQPYPRRRRNAVHGPGAGIRERAATPAGQKDTMLRVAREDGCFGTGRRPLTAITARWARKMGCGGGDGVELDSQGTPMDKTIGMRELVILFCSRRYAASPG